MTARRHIILTWVALATATLAGCAAKITNLTSADVLENQYVSFRAPSMGWYVLPKAGVWRRNGSGEVIHLDADREGAHYNLSVNTYPESTMPSKELFDPKYEGLPRGEMDLNDNDLEQGISYKRRWRTYVGGMRCSGSVFSRRFGGSAYQAMSKNYSVTCGYYDKSEGRRLVFFLYRYNYALGDARLQEDEGKKRSELLTQQQAEDGLKEAIKELVGSLVIKNLDRERMEQEGLWHPGRPFEVSEF